MTATHFATVTEARKHFSDLITAAESGRPGTVQRERHRAAVVDAERLRASFSRLLPANVEAVPEAGGWSIFLTGLPIAADGDTFDSALDELIDALREYAEDWSDHLRHAPNHEQNWDLVQLVELSTDEQLKEWLQQ
ncbi:MAG: hypothetical protein QM650_05580 [Microlunatus sp.]